MTVDEIRARLRDAYAPTHLEVIDESHLHRGHAGVRDAKLGQVTHVRIVVASEAFAGKTPIAMHRAVNAVFADVLASGEIHAMTIEANAG